MLQRIKQYIDSKGINVAAFERSIGMSNASFGKSLKNNGTIGCDKLEIILKVYPEINPTWLLTGNGAMLLKIETPAESVAPAQVFSGAVEECKRCENLERIIKGKEDEIGVLRQLVASKDEIINNLRNTKPATTVAPVCVKEKM